MSAATRLRQTLARIADYLGRPFKEADLRREHARPASRGARPWTYAAVAAGLTPSKLAGLFTAADGGDNKDLLTLAADLERRDSHAGAQLRTRKLALAGLPWQVEAVDDSDAEKNLAAELQALVMRPSFVELVIHCMDAVLKGYSVAEIEWERGAKFVPKRFVWRDPRHFCFDKEDGSTLRLRTEAQPQDGEDLPAFKFITHVPILASGPVATAGLIRPLAVMYSVKTLGVGAWLAYMEVFGVPTRIGKYPTGAPEDDVDALERAVQMIGIDGSGVMPNTTQIEVLDATGRGNGTGEHEKLARWADEQVSKAVLGQTMTADSGSSLSQAKIHQLVRRDILLADALALAATLQRDFIQVYVDVNYGPRDLYPQIRCLTEEPEDRKAFVDALVPLVDRGLRVEQSVVRDKIGIPEPAEDVAPEDLLQPMSKAPAAAPTPGDEEAAPPAKGPAAKASRTGRRPAQLAVEGEDFIDKDLASVDWGEAGAEVLAAVRRAKDGATNFTDFLARLRDESADVSKLVESLALRTLQARGVGDATDEVTP